MKFFAHHSLHTLCLTLGAVLAIAMIFPFAAQAATDKSASGQKNKVVASKLVAQKKAISLKKTVATKAIASKKLSSKQSVNKTAGKAFQREAMVGKRGKSSTVRLTRVQQRETERLVARNKPNREVGSKKSKREVVATASRNKNKVPPPVSFVRVAMTQRISKAERLGLRDAQDALDLNSSVALVVDQLTGEVLFSKNDSAVLPIASITKLMTGLILADAHLPMDELITITQEDVDTYKNSSSRLSVGTTASRGELMHLALMSSENRAAHALGRTYPGGLTYFVRLMNAKAHDLGMNDTRYVDPTGLMSQNQSSARDLATLVSAAYDRPILRDLSTSPSHEFDRGDRTLQYNNTNRLIRNPEWNIGLQKTGYISEAGRCMVMQANVAGRPLIMVFLDASGRSDRAQDAERVRHWIEAQGYRRNAIQPQS